MRIIVDNRIRLDVGDLSSEQLEQLRSPFTYKNPDYEKKKHLGRILGKNLVWGEKPLVETWKSDGPGKLSFPRGGMERVRKALRSLNIAWKVIDARSEGFGPREIPKHNVELYPHQVRIVDAALEKQQCIIRAPTGSGKTSALLAVASEINLPTLVIVHSAALARQWIERAESELGMHRSDIGYVGGGKKLLRPLTIGIQKTVLTLAETSRDFRKYFGAVLGDEVHLFAAKSFIAAVDPFPAKYRIGASADHRRKDRKEFLIHDIFGEVAEDVSREELVDTGHVLDVQVRVVPTDFRADWYGVPDEEHQDKKMDFVKLCHDMAVDAGRNALAVNAVVSEVDTEEQVLVMAHEREHCRMLSSVLSNRLGGRVGLMLGGADEEISFRSSLIGLRNGAVIVGVGTYKAIGTGIDLPKIGVGVGVTPIAANEQFFGQVRGRVCRRAEGKSEARLYYLWDRHVFGRKHLENLAKWNKNTVVRTPKGDWSPVREWLAEWG